MKRGCTKISDDILLKRRKDKSAILNHSDAVAEFYVTVLAAKGISV
jgi:hypothetical protein